MSGLAALYHREGHFVDRATITAMLAAAPYRGLDGMSIRLWDTVALGHARMVVTPEEEQERQPLVSPRTGCALSADVRLDNRADLLAKLPEQRPDTTSDAELILRAYEAWGVDAITRLLGDFALILWDPRDHRLICARDTSGQRTLFYRSSARVFAAASEIQQLLQDPDVPMRPNEEHIRRRLAPLNMFRNEKDSATTYYEGIYAVPAGHILTVDHQELRVWRYWELTPPAELRYRTGDQYVEHFRALFFDVVRARLRTARPIGALLSGGLDSSSLVATAQQLYRAGTVSGSRFISYSALFEGLECDERGLIRDLQDMYGFEARYIPCEDVQGRLQLDAPGFLESPNMVMGGIRDSICSAATPEGVRVLLSGDVADSCVGGSRLVFDSLLRQGHLRAFWRHLRAYRGVSDESLSTIILFACLGPLLPLPAQRWLQTRHARRECQRQSRRWLPEWMCEPLREDLRLGQIQLWLETERGRRFANPARETEYNLLYPAEIVRHPVPWPIEIWRPFADRRLHEFLLAIPPEQKFEPHPDTNAFYAGSKHLLRRAMQGILPESVRTRTAKTGFQSQVKREIEQQWSMYAAAFGPSARPEIARIGYVNQHRFWSRLTQLRTGEYGPDLVYVLEMIGLETWLRALQRPRSQATSMPLPVSEGQPRLDAHRQVEIQSGNPQPAGQPVRC